MRYLLVSDFNFPEHSFNEFESFISDKRFDGAVFCGDMAAAGRIHEMKEKADSILKGKPYVYVRGNTERASDAPFLKDYADIDGWHIIHGHQYDPGYSKFFQYFFRQRADRKVSKALFKAVKFVRGIVKHAYGDINCDELESGVVPRTAGKVVGRIFPDACPNAVCRKVLSKEPYDKVALGHFHPFSHKTYADKAGAKVCAFLPAFPDFAYLEDGRLIFQESRHES